MESWGRDELVAAPADADLVFEIRFTAPLTCSSGSGYVPQLDLAILDAKTHFLLWTFTELVEGAFKKATWERNFSQGMASLMADIKKLTVQPGAVGNRISN